MEGAPPEKLEAEAATPLDQMKRAVADLWSQSISTGDDWVAFYDHDGKPARLRWDGTGYRIAWVIGPDDSPEWDESDDEFDNPRQAALHAFQGAVRGGR